MDPEDGGLHERRHTNAVADATSGVVDGHNGNSQCDGEDKGVGRIGAGHPRWKRILQNMFGMDIRALAASRILTACVLLYEGLAGMDWWNVRAFMTDFGVWPGKAVMEYTDFNFWQIHIIHRGESWAYFLHIVFLVSALLLLVGWHTKKATLFCWLYWIEVQNRTYPISHSFDKQLQFLLMWALLGLPWGACCSIDAALAGKPGKERVQPPRLLCSVATFGMCLETITIYCLTSFHKTNPCWMDGTAVIFALETRYIARPLATALVENAFTHQLLLIAGQVTRPMEVMAPTAMLMPWHSLKILAVVTLVGFHVGLAITLRLNDITFINTSVLLLFLPALFWDRLHVAWLQMMPSRIAMQPWQTIREVASALQGLGLAAAASTPHEPEPQKPVLWATRMMNKRPLASRVLLTALGIWLIVYRIWVTMAVVCGGGAGEACKGEWWTMWQWMHSAGNIVRLDTNWKVFSDRPPNQDMWLVFPAKLENEREIDIFPALRGPAYFQEPFFDVTEDVPAAPAYTFRDERWTKYLEAAVVPGWKTDDEKKKSDQARMWLGQFLCREWNKRHGKGPHRLVSLEMLLFLVDNSVIRTVRAEPERVSMWNHVC